MLATIAAAAVIALLALGFARATYVIGYERGRRNEQTAVARARAAVPPAAPPQRGRIP
jgi:hypothetical protein